MITWLLFKMVVLTNIYHPTKFEVNTYDGSWDIAIFSKIQTGLFFYQQVTWPEWNWRHSISFVMVYHCIKYEVKCFCKTWDIEGSGFYRVRVRSGFWMMPINISLETWNTLSICVKIFFIRNLYNCMISRTFWCLQILIFAGLHLEKLEYYNSE